MERKPQTRCGLQRGHVAYLYDDLQGHVAAESVGLKGAELAF
jgi:hypothetical protein